MSKHLTGLDLTFCQSLVNVFLIRDPEKLIASYAKVIRDIPESEVGLKAAWEQYQAMQEKGWKTVVLNSDIMLENPPLILAKLCQQIDIPFDPAMLKWEAGPCAEDGPWAKYWYSSVHRSTGFEAKPRQKIPLHEAYQPLLSRVKPYFDRLNQFTIIP